MPKRGGAANTTAPPSLPFETDNSDHAETPAEAYADIAPLLDALARATGRTRATLRIYDPYYCDGGAARRLGALGFRCVRNEPVDCYAEWAADAAGATGSRAARPYDVLVTNPPYSGDHLQRLCAHLEAALAPRGAPWLVLVPSFVCARACYAAALAAAERARARARGAEAETGAAFVVPHKRYAYRPPAWAAAAGGGGGGRAPPATTAPFVSLWLGAHLGPPGARALCGALDARRVRVCHALAALPNDARDATDPARKRLNPKARKRAAAKRRAAAAGYAGGGGGGADDGRAAAPGAVPGSSDPEGATRKKKRRKGDHSADHSY